MPNYFFHVINTLQPLILNFGCHLINSASHHCNFLLQLFSIVFGFCYPK